MTTIPVTLRITKGYSELQRNYPSVDGYELFITTYPHFLKKPKETCLEPFAGDIPKATYFTDQIWDFVNSNWQSMGAFLKHKMKHILLVHKTLLV